MFTIQAPGVNGGGIVNFSSESLPDRKCSFVLQKSITAQIRQLFFIITDTKNKSTDLCGNRLLQNDFINSFREIRTRREHLNYLKTVNATTGIRSWWFYCDQNRSIANGRDTHKIRHGLQKESSVQILGGEARHLLVKSLLVSCV